MRFLLFLLALAVVSCAPAPHDSAPMTLADASFTPEAKRAAPASSPESTYAKQQIHQGSVSLEASDPARVEAQLTEKVSTLGGFVESSVASGTSRSLVLRVPQTHFDAFMEALGSSGKVLHREVSVTDVTTQYYDLDTRLKNQRLLLDQYRSFLSQTKKMDEILDVMGRISELTTEIESTEGQFRYLAAQVNLSTVRVELSPPLLSGRSWPDWDHQVSEMLHGLADFGVGTVIFVIWLLVAGPVVLALVAFVVWLFVGRPGLWRLLRRLGKSGKTSEEKL